jgi:hypothetical protein
VRAMIGSRAGVAIQEPRGVIASELAELAGVAAWAGTASTQRQPVEMRHFVESRIPPSIGNSAERS